MIATADTRLLCTLDSTAAAAAAVVHRAASTGVEFATAVRNLLRSAPNLNDEVNLLPFVDLLRRFPALDVMQRIRGGYSILHLLVICAPLLPIRRVGPVSTQDTSCQWAYQIEVFIDWLIEHAGAGSQQERINRVINAQDEFGQ
ncbi:MAG: hypothetical protein Q7T57_00235 [Dehalococcoidales bacterium]|nr:hypothetical protein [Dehalococcoidales bacterium]